VFALPGTPGAARIAFEILVRPALRAMLGYRHLHRPSVTVRLAQPLKVTPGRRRYLWAHLTLSSSRMHIVPLGGQGTATLRSSSDANALIVLQPSDADLPAGSTVAALLLTSDESLVGELPVPLQGCVRAIGIVGPRGAGKTTLIERLIPELNRRGLTVAVVKHHAHLDLSEGDQTDTARFARAGATETVLAGPGGAVHRHAPSEDPSVDEVLGWVGPADLVLVEGYSQSSLPKILVRRGGVETDRQPPADPVIAVVTDAPVFRAETDGGVPRFGWDDLVALGEFIVRRDAGSRVVPR
jgi:molybdopterin-guanine dinucleotide biosynthesis protein B